MGKERLEIDGSRPHTRSTRIEAIQIGGYRLTRGKFIRGSFYAHKDSEGRPLNKTFKFEGVIVQLFPDGFSLPTGIISFSQEKFKIEEVR